tara:strand:- start:2254 stop:2442 length:189 start_codon:yes stop_codon:yes gene_type:complete
MELWQLIYIRVVICGFISQFLFIIGIIYLFKALPNKNNPIEILEKLYKEDVNEEKGYKPNIL